MILGKKKKEQVEAVVRQRDLIVSYKRVFGGQEGKEVLFDLMNRFHILSETGGDLIKEGQRSAVIHILTQTGMNLAEFDKLVKGEGYDAINN